jgi:hypothetical protein
VYLTQSLTCLSIAGDMQAADEAAEELGGDDHAMDLDNGPPSDSRKSMPLRLRP